MPEPKRPLKVFLSYASQDKSLVRELSRRLVGEGWIDTWQDEKNLLPGQDWRVKIEEAVEDADVIIIVLSQHSVSKEGHVQKELRYAREIALEKPEDAIFLIPLRLDECEVPRGLRFYQWVDYFGDNKDSSYKTLVASLRLRYEQKIKSEEAERLRKEQQEREIAESIAREKAEKDAVEKARLKAEKEERQRIAKEKADREAASKLALENAEKEAAEKARLESEELARQKTAKEKAEREATERVEKERKAKELREKQVRESREKEKRESEKKEEKPVAVKPKAGRQIAYWFGGFFVLILGIIFLSSLNTPPPGPQPTPENTQTESIVTLAQDTAEATAKTKSTSTPLVTQTPKSLYTEITDAKGVPMMLVPAGEFVMGTNSGFDNDKPAHTIYLDEYYIDKYEVTNALYKTCVNEGVCNLPNNLSSSTRSDYYENPKYDNYPLVYINWAQAKTYCEWRGAYLPTEAQWEKAARGKDERNYPWGEGVTCADANLCEDDTSEVGFYKKNVSFYGVYDMVGNVFEMTADWYGIRYYPVSPASNPTGPSIGDRYVVRGGSYDLGEANLGFARLTMRWSSTTTDAAAYNGFRCAK